MQQAINIYTLTGQRIDCDAESIEQNMGGIPLLSLSDRSASYTNSFKIPRTPNNEAIFLFASQYTRTNKVNIDVIISKGFFQQRANLKLTSFDNEYSASITWDSSLIIDKLKNQGIDVFDNYCNLTFITNTDINTYQAFIQRIYNLSKHLTQSDIDNGIGWYVFPILTNVLDTSTVTLDPSLTEHITYNLFSSVPLLLKKSASLLGITIDGDLFDDIYFQKLVIQNNQYQYRFEDHDTDQHTYSINGIMKKTTDINIKNIMLSDVIKAVSQIFACDIEINGSNISLNKVENKLHNTGVWIETLEGSKEFYTGYSKYNTIRYTAKDDSKKDYGSDVFEADGIGTKDVLTISSIIPKTDSVGYVCDLENTNGNIVIGILSNSIELKSGSIYVYDYNPYGENYSIIGLNLEYSIFNILSMTGFYSGFLGDIFSNTSIVNASGYISPDKIKDLFSKRILNSIKLGGRYWIETMAYNYVTGQSKLKLIKLS